MPHGTLTRLFEVRGFGFITPDESDRDVFLGIDVISSSTEVLREGQRVQYEAVDAAPGLKAVSVQPINA
ncbi:MAG: cold shock domain-containing protein [Phycisphaerales bacterium]|jgi:CspA family cold shock protein|nr:cold shock domain-containing protein [Phycisphaerales bacterium]